MQNDGVIQDSDTNGAMLPLDLGLYESGSISPRATMDRLGLVDASGVAYANTEQNHAPRYSWVSLPSPTPQDYFDHQQHTDRNLHAKEQEYEGIIRDNTDKITLIQNRLAKFAQGSGVNIDDQFLLRDIEEAQEYLKDMRGHAKIIKETKERQKHLSDYRAVTNLMPNDSVFKIGYQYGHGPLVVRYGINSVQFSNWDAINSNNVLSLAEFHALYSAVQYLDQMQPGNEAQAVPPVYKNNIVLCDIFCRNDGIIPPTTSGIPETHTVVLWKIKNATASSNAQIILIDPNNSRFSELILTHSITNFEIKSPKEFSNFPYNSFYSRGSCDPGRMQSATRDCIDIAVKIGFELNELQLRYTRIDLILDRLHDAMSNERECGERAPNLKLMRDAHSSDPEVRKRFQYLRKIINNLHEVNTDINKEVFNNKLWQ